MNRVSPIMWFCLILCFVAGCASTPKIHYTPEKSSLKANNVSARIQKFEDGRGNIEKGMLGGVYNGYNMRIGDVKEPEGMIASIQEAFAAELTHRGYTLVEDDRDLVIRASVQTVTCDVANKREANLIVQLSVLDKGVQVISKIYKGNSSIFMSLDMTCSEPLGKAIEDIVKKFSNDLDEYIRS